MNAAQIKRRGCLPMACTTGRNSNVRPRTGPARPSRPCVHRRENLPRKSPPCDRHCWHRNQASAGGEAMPEQKCSRSAKQDSIIIGDARTRSASGGSRGVRASPSGAPKVELGTGCFAPRPSRIGSTAAMARSSCAVFSDVRSARPAFSSGLRASSCSRCSRSVWAICSRVARSPAGRASGSRTSALGFHDVS